MKVFVISRDVSSFSMLVRSGDNTGPTPSYGLSMPNWSPPKLHVHNPLIASPNFWSTSISTSFIFDAGNRPFDELPLIALFEDAGELLPVDVEDIGRLMLLNVTTVANAIDRDKTRWKPSDKGRFKYIEDVPGSFAFHGNRLPETCIFKIPQNNAAQMFCIEWTGDPDREFKAAVEHEKLTGLRFQLVWEA